MKRINIISLQAKKKDDNNRSEQLNPNNEKFWKSRGREKPSDKDIENYLQKTSTPKK